MKENKIVYGLIGFGGMGKWHTEILENVPEIELAGIYDIKEEKRKLAEEAGFHTYETEEAILADESIDVILVATPNDTHRPIALRAMEAGKNVIVEKPATLSLKELTELEDMAGKTGQFLTVHQNRRWDEDLLTVREILKDQTMGEIFRIESRVHGSRGIPGDWRKEKAHGGGMVLDWGVHLFDQIFRLTGERRLKTVYATLTNVTNQEVDDGFTAVLRFEGGLEVLVEVGTNNFISLPRWYVLGENGSGKTTLMNMISGIYYPDEGQILVNGKEVTIRSPKDSFALGIGMIHQHFKLVDVLTAAENIILGLPGKEVLDMKALRQRSMN